MGIRYAEKLVPKHSLKLRSRQLRREQTPQEQVLWDLLRERKASGLKFRRQHQIGPYIVDFYCAEKKLVIELDGAGHFTRPGTVADKERDETLEELGLKVLRFPNGAAPGVILGEIEALVSKEEL